MKQRHAISLPEGVSPGDRVRGETAARKRQLRHGNAPRRVYSGEACLHELVAAQAARTPRQAAVSCEGRELTYGDLLDRARGLAGHLRALGMGPETRVGICAERSLELVVGVLGTLTAGAAYVPLDPSYPAERLAYMLENAGAPVLLAQEKLSAILPPHPARVVRLDGSAEHGAFAAPPAGPLAPSLPESLAYVMYTSGSTGRPKGVMNTHRGVRNRLLWQRDDFGLRADDRVLQKTPFSFDISVWELLAPLIAGARLVMARPGGHRDPAYLVEVIERERITVVHFVASMMRAFLGAPGLERLSSLRCVVNGGEALPPEVERRFFERFGTDGPRLYNLYGPTEAAIEATWWTCEPANRSATVPIGRPIANVSVRILGADLQPATAGELHIGGVAPARGYLGRPDLTAEKFIPDPFARTRGGRLYKTGDLSRFRRDGIIEYLGRIDNQVKIRGFRIELGEIEATLAEHPSVRAAVVTARERNGEPRLAAYVVSAGGGDASGLRSHLAARLPDYMVPADFVFLEELPLTPSGKVDRKALPEPRRAEREHAPPATPLEGFLAGLWQEALGVERAGRHDSFFELGGTSISAAVVTNHLQRELGEIVHAVVLFDAPTVSELAAYLSREHGEAVARIWGAESVADAPAVLPRAGRRIGEAEVAELRGLIPPLPPASETEPKNPPAVFIVAPPRSGTTLLRVMLGGHPALFAPPELELLSFNTLAERRGAFPGRDAFWLQGLLRAVLELRGGGLEEAEDLVASWERDGWTTARVYRQLQEWIGGRILVDKTTSYGLDPAILGRAEEEFDSPFYIHLVRHPYGMIRSFEEARIEQVFFRRPHSFSRRELAELIWLVSHRNIAAHLAGVPAGRRHRLRFEDLVRDPEAELRRLCAGLGLDYHPDMAEPYREARARMTDGVHAEGGMLGDMKFHQHRGVDPAAAERWRQAYTEDFLGEPAWDKAVAFGYERQQRARPILLERVPRRPGEPLPLSPAQERLWFLDRLVPGSAAYNIAREIRLNGRLDVPALGAALGEIVRRHEVLRTVFEDRDGSPVQIVQPIGGERLPLIDLAVLPEPARKAEARRLAMEVAQRPFDLARDPMLRCVLLRLDSEAHALLLVLHHIAADGWSMEVLASELAALYRGLAAGGPALPPLPLQYADYAVWQRRWLESEEPAARLAAWRQRLADLPEVLELPADRPRPAVQSFRGAVERIELDAEAGEALESLARRGGATVFMALLAVFQTLLHRLTGQEDLAVGVPAANRNRPGLEGLIGFFVNSLVLRADFAGDPAFSAALGRVREAALFAYAHQDLPFERLVAELAPERSLDHAPLYQVMLSLQETPVPALDLGRDLRGELLEIHTGTSKFDLWLQLARHAGGLTAKAEYASDLFEAATAARLLRSFKVLLEGAVAAPDTRISELPLLDDADRAQVLVEWNRTAVELPGVLVHARFEARAREAPEALAVAWSGGELTYGELNRRANRLAHRLLRLGIGAGDTVAIRLERSPELVAAAVAAIKTGAAYLPIDPAHPAERLTYMLRDSGAALLLTVERLALPGMPVTALALDGADLSGESEDDPQAPSLGLDGLAYVIYTSGSTGAPKGTELTHRGLANLVAWDHRYIGRRPADRCSLVAGTGFDASVWETWSTLAAGASLHVPPAELVLSPPDLLAWLAERRITVAFLPAVLAESILAEPLPPGLALRAVPTGADRLNRRPNPDTPFELINAYGPTESTVLATAGRVAPYGERLPEIGSPLDNTQIYILDRGLQPLPAGVPGELCIAGDWLARGYRRRPEMTAERFVPNPFGAPGARMYRTGDLARWLPDGEIEFLGRIDFQVKLRGFRIELGEIQAVLGRHPAVREALVLARGDGSGLCAYVVLRQPAAAGARDQFRSFLAESLPEYMIPAAWVFLDSLPLTPNGKVDRRALARIEPAAEPEAAAAPRTPIEELLAGLFMQVLGGGRAIGVHEDFFHLGGHSLLAMRLASRVREACGVDVGVRGVFEAPTVARLAERIAAGSRHPEAPPLVPVPREGGLPLSFAQQRLWFLETLRPGTALYNLTHVYELRGGLSVPALAAALAEVVRRHEALRTTFVRSGEGEPRQVVAPAAAEPLPLVDLAALPEAARRAEAERWADAEARRPYDLARGPLLRTALFRQDSDEYRLLLGMHHIVADAWSFGVLLQEVAALYLAFAEWRPSPLAPLAIQYPDFAVWQRRWLAGDALEEQLAWWRERLAGAPEAIELPADRPRSATPSLAGGVERLALGVDAAAGLSGLSRRCGATLFMTALAAFQALLHRYTGQEDLVVGSPVAGRGRLELERLIGFFVNMLALRADLAGDPAFQGLLAAVRETALGAYAHQDLPFDRLVEELSPDRDSSRAPIFQIVFAVQDVPARPDLGPGIATMAAAVHSGTAKFDLALFLERGPDGIEIFAEHATDLFEGATVRRLLGHYRVLLAGIVADPTARVSELPLLDPEEREQVVAGWNHTATAIPDAPVHVLFAERARLAPEATAVVAGDQTLTYGELDCRASRLAAALRRRGVGPEVIVALLLERSPELVTAALGVLKACGAYLPIDPAYPAERILHMLRDSGARVLVTTTTKLAFPGTSLEVLSLKAADLNHKDEDVAEVPDLGPAGLAYVIYTSGSTGLPKGAELCHRGLSNLCAWHLRAYGLGTADRSALVAGPGFDASVWEMWPPLVAGASLHVPAPELVRDPPALLAWLAGEGITVAFLPTPLAEAVLAEPPPARLALRALLTGGDRLRRRPGAGLPFALINHYGPTESTVVATAEVVEPDGERLPGIGKAIDNTRVLVLDRVLRPLPAGIPGELCIAGDGLARSYRGRPELTAERFLPDPFGPPDGRLYRTGDLVRRLMDGSLDFLGRIDHQVKIRGLRIELGEIEAALQGLPGVEAAAVLAREDRTGDRRLAAYVVASGAPEEELREALLRRLPETMVPSAWVFLSAMPLTANGKIDRRELAQIAPPEPVDAGVAEGPRNPVEEIVGDLFAEILGLDRPPGIHDDFFRLGGHSLLVVHLASRLRAAFGADLDLTAIFDRPTVAGVAELVATAAREERPPAPPLVPAARGEAAALSFAQQRLWFLDRFETSSSLYNITVAFHIQGGGPRLVALVGALEEVVRRHEALRSVFREPASGEPVQVVLPFAPRGLPVVDLTGLRGAAAEAARLAKEAAMRPFDLARGPLLRSLLLRLGAADHRLILAMHHIVSDGWSVGVMVREISELYRAFAAGRPSPLPPLPVQYSDFALWQRRWLGGDAPAAEISWWRERLAGIPDGLELPADRPRPPVQSFRGGVRRATIDSEVAEGLAALSRRQGVTSFMTAAATFFALLHRWGAGEDLVVGTPVAGRDRAEIEGLIGFFVNTLVLRASLAGDPDVREVLARVRATALAAYAHQDLPFERLVAELAPQRDLSRTPLFQVLVALQEAPPSRLALGSGLAAPMSEVWTDTAKFDLSLHFSRTGESLTASAEYAADLFDSATIDRFLGHLCTLLAGIVAAPESQIADLPLLTEEERRQLAVWQEELRREHPAGEVLHGLFEAQAARKPGAVALVWGGEALTYADLEMRSARLAQRLRGLGIGPEVPVGICLPRTPDLVVSLLAVLRAGGFYVPLDPAYPAERLAVLLEDSGCELVLTDAAVEAALPPSRARLLRLEEVGKDGKDSRDDKDARTPVLPGNLAYLIYTSGSTGRPKAVAIEHRSAVLLAYWAREVFSAEEFAGVLASTSITFDMSVFEIFVTLAWGGTLILVENALALQALKAAGALPSGIEVRLLDTVPSAAAELLAMDGLPESVRTINLGGEAVPRALADRAYRRPETERLYNLYGPSEDTTFSSIALIERASARAPSIGIPLHDKRAWVLDRRLRPVPVGVPGELYLAGGGLARGYRGRPELTAERFLPDPFGELGTRMYRVGDLVRWRADGELEYLGRLDHQVKIRGFRVELGEIEAALVACPGVEEAAVVAREDEQGVRRLVAYVAAGALAPEPLREALKRRLPAFMIPANFVLLAALPRTPNGKVDRRSLPSPEPLRAIETELQAPRTPLEMTLAGLWAQVLGVAEVSVHDSFFELGGHSLLATRIVSRVRELFGIELPLRAFFDQPTIAGIASVVEGLMSERSGAPSLERVSPSQLLKAPLSYAQQRLWFLDRLQPDLAVYNLPVVLAIEGPLSADVLEAAISEIVRRHAVLRTTFSQDTENGEPVQLVAEAAPHPLARVDLTGLPEPLGQQEAERLLAEEQRRPFDLERGPLLRALLVRLGPARHRLNLAMHHIVSDGWSIRLLLRELETLYRGFSAGWPSPLPELPAQYADFAVWQRRWLDSGELEAQLAWWRQTLAGSPPALDLPADHPRPAVASLRGGTATLVLAPEFAAAVEVLGHRLGTTPFMTYLAVFEALLHRYTGEEDLWIGTPVAGRARVETEDLIGCFVNMLVLRTGVGGEPGFATLLRRVRETALAAYAHPDVPFEKLVEELEPARDLSRSPLFQVVFSVEADAEATIELAPGLSLAPLFVETGTSKFDLTLWLWKTADDSLTAAIEYALDLFEPAAIQRMLGHFAELLAGAAAHPETAISDLPLLTEEERRQLASWCESVRREHPAGEVLHGLFEAQAARTPRVVALVCGGEALTYADLERRSARLAQRLHGLGIGPEVPVGICLPRTPDLVVALLAVLRAGGFYVPLDPAYPAERLAILLEDSGCELVLTDAAVEAALPPSRARRLRLEEVGKDGKDSRDDKDARTPVLPGNLAYLIYTSGSTGRPKAVAIEHRSTVLLAYWARETFSAEDFAGVLASTSITFDMSVFEIFVTLAWGGTLILVENALALPSLKAEGALPAGIEVRLLDTVPSAAAELLAMDGLPASVRTINLGGEAVPRALADRAYRRPATERLYNLYGPSEDTTFSSIALIERESARAPSIGVPLHDKRAWVLDRRLRPVPVGVPGELYLAGGGLARGYRGRPELTAERFLPDPFSEPGTRMYRVGDLVRWRADGELEYLGRLDHQVKIRGFRVELGEIEAALAACPGVEEAVVAAREDEPGVRRLVAYVAGAPEVSAGELRQRLQDRLPAYMVPAVFVLLEALPHTPNGKVDRRALPAPEAERALEAEPQAPRTPLEKTLAGLWAQVLGVDGVGVHDSFFELGGHSLLATRIASRVRELFGVELPLRAFFEQPTIAGIAMVIEDLIRERSGAPSLKAVSLGQPLKAPLSYTQQRLWFLDRLQPGLAVYNLPVVLGIEGPLAAEVVEAALSEIVRRHAALRTTFRQDSESGEPAQLVAEAVPQRLARVDLSGLSEPLRQREAEWLLAGEQRRPFDLERGPVLRASLVRLGPMQHWLILTMHHIVSDGWSIGVLLRELETLYRAFSEGRPSPLSELPAQYADFAVWQRRWLGSGELESQLAWWRQTLAGRPPALELPADHPRPAVPSLRGGTATLALDPQLAAAVERLGTRQGATPFMTLLAAFEILLHRYTGEEDLWIGTPVAGRNRGETEDLIGCFVNTLVLRTNLGGEPSFATFLGRVRATALAAYAHPDMPFEKLVEELAPARDLARSPLFDVSFSVQEEWSAPAELGPGVTLIRRPAETGTAKFDLSLGIWKAADGAVALGAEYSLDLFEPATVGRILGHFAELLAGAAADPNVSVGDLPLLTAVEREQIRRVWSGGDTIAVSAPTLHGLVRRQARHAPGALAIASGAERLTYEELDVRARRLARRLRAAGVVPEMRVALCAGRSPELVVGFLGILLASGVCVPLDSAQPPERLAFLLADSGAAALVTTPDLAPLLPAADLPRLLVTAAETVGAATEAGAPVLSENLAYVIYTSGSTGQPKGVAVTHHAATEHCETAARAYGLGPDDRVPLFASPAFDVAVEEIFATLVAGATLVVAGSDAWVPGDLSRMADELELTVVNLPTAVWQQWVQELDPLDVPRSLRLVIVGGEEVPAPPARRWLGTPFAAVRLLNGYGPTEAVVTATLYEVGPKNLGNGSSVPIGSPLRGRSARVLDPRLRPVPIGVPGELCLGGCLARGYLGQPALTAERFVPDPSGAPGARLYRSGDLARLRPDGVLEFMSRIDRQVKVRGFRIEPGEIEAALISHPAVAAAVVLARETDGERRLVAYLEPREEAPSTAELRSHLEQRLPAYMIPAAFVVLDRLPLTASGKIDRAVLPAPEAARDLEAEFVAPRTAIEKQLAQLWSAVLGVEGVGIHDSFWQLGGHSLLATRITSRVREALGVELPLRAFFEGPTIASLAERIQQAVRERTGRIEPESRRTAPLSYPQQRLWFLDRLQPGLAAYNLPLVLRVEGALSAAALESALAEIGRRHEVLRTTFAVDAEGEPVQVVAPWSPHGMSCVDLSGLAKPLRESEAERLISAEVRRPFNLGQGPLLRSLLTRLRPGEHLLTLAMHHIVSDGWSIGVLLRELRTFYGALAAGEPSRLPALPIQYADFAAWQRRWLVGGELAAQLDWWRQYLAGSPPPLDLPTDHPRPPVQSLRGATERLTIEPELAAAIERLGLRRGATFFMTLLTVFETLLHRYTAQDDLWIGTPVAHRTRAETEELIGFFVNTLVLRSDLRGEPSFDELLGRVRETTLAAYMHQDVPFEKLVEELAPVRDLSRSPLFQVSFSAEGTSDLPEELAPGVSLMPLAVDTGTAKFDLSLGLWRSGGALTAEVEYSQDLFEPATARRLLGHFAVLLAGIAGTPEARISDLPLLGAEEQRQLQAVWSGSELPALPATTLHALVEAQARRRPEAVAVLCGGERLTYAELMTSARKLAHRLSGLGVRPEMRVALCIESSVQRVVGFLAVLQSGAACVPLDPAHPPERLAFLLEDSGAVVVVTTPELAPGLPEHLPSLLVPAADVDPGPAESPSVWPEHLAYVIYTSGSTGRPKGVAVEHRAAAEHCRTMIRAYRRGPRDRVLQFASAAFDVSIEETFVTLAAGATLILRGNRIWSGEDLARRVNELELTALNLPPVLWHEWVRACESLAEPPQSLRLVIVGGEEISTEHASRWLRTPLAPVRLLNAYGPTETVVTATLHDVVADGATTGGSVPIGRPLPGRCAHVLDRRSHPLPFGVPGELHLGGHLARGYLGRPELTAERFIPDPFGEPGARLYRTGDLARCRRDGALEFLGRIDQQVKVRGFRIELPEVEMALAAQPGIEDVLVLARRDQRGDKRLVAYLVRRDQRITSAELRSALRERLPEYMVPSAFVFLPAFPLTANGKLDRKALPAPEETRDLGVELVGPRTPLEQQVADIWETVLGLDHIGVQDSFWDLGGHSLLATKVLSRVREDFGIDLPLSSLFMNPLLAEFSEAVGRSVLAAQGDDIGSLLSELDGLSDEEIRALLTTEEAALEELT
jgi:amino acid adenylation domain-containing protein